MKKPSVPAGDSVVAAHHHSTPPKTSEVIEDYSHVSGYTPETYEAELTDRQLELLEFAADHSGPGYGDEEDAADDTHVLLERRLITRENLGVVQDVWVYLATEAGRKILKARKDDAKRAP